MEIIKEDGSLKEKISIFIKELRLERGIKHQTHLARELGVEKQTMSKLEKGQQEWNLYYLLKLSRILDFKLAIENGNLNLSFNKDDCKKEKIAPRYVNLKYAELVKNIGEFKIVKLFAPRPYNECEYGTNLMQYVCYTWISQKSRNKNLNYDKRQIIFDNKKEVVDKFSDCMNIDTIYTVVDKDGNIPEGIDDYYATINDALAAYYMICAPILFYNEKNQPVLEVVDEDSYLVKIRCDKIKNNFNEKVEFYLEEINDYKFYLDILENNEYEKLGYTKDEVESILNKEYNGFAIVNLNGVMKKGVSKPYPYYSIIQHYKCFELIDLFLRLDETMEKLNAVEINLDEKYSLEDKNETELLKNIKMLHEKYLSGDIFKFNETELKICNELKLIVKEVLI